MNKKKKDKIRQFWPRCTGCKMNHRPETARQRDASQINFRDSLNTSLPRLNNVQQDNK